MKDSLIAWMRDNKTSSWASGLLFVQWGMNTTYHEAIKIQLRSGNDPRLAYLLKFQGSFGEN